MSFLEALGDDSVIKRIMKFQTPPVVPFIQVLQTAQTKTSQFKNEIPDKDTLTKQRFSDLAIMRFNFEQRGHLARYVRLRVAHAPGMPETFSPPPCVNDPNIHQGTCVTHLPWYMPGSLTSDFFEVGGRENVPGIPDARTTHNFTYLAIGPRARRLPQILWGHWGDDGEHWGLLQYRVSVRNAS